MKPQIKLVTSYQTKGTLKLKNIIGYYRECEETICKRLIPCPYVKCDEHGTAFGRRDVKIKHYEPEEVESKN